MNKKKVILILLTMILVGTLTACVEDANREDRESTIKVAQVLATNQPTPDDINFSLERYNLIKRAYWVNGQREKAMNVECPITRPLGYVILIDNGAIVGQYCVDGKVTSLNSFLTPDSECYSAGSACNKWLADVDGSYGENDEGIFFFTPEGNYYEWTGRYLYSDIPFHLDTPTLTIQEAIVQ